MRGDKLVVGDEHIRAARQAMALLLPAVIASPGHVVITIAGESGSGKSEIAAALADALRENGIRSHVLQQDDYFIYPPKTNEAIRHEDISHVGMQEVRLDRLDKDLGDILSGDTEIAKPLVIFDDDTIAEETVNLEGTKVILVEGTYTTTLQNVHRRIFIDRDFKDTLETRRRRAREAQDDFLERVLAIEHGIIAAQKNRADIIVTRDYQARENEPRR